MKNTWRAFPTFRVNDTKDAIDISLSAATTSVNNEETLRWNSGQQPQVGNCESNEKTKRILESLTDNELEIAAQTYYDYTIDNQTSSSSTGATTAASLAEDKNKNERRIKYATALANQYIHWYANDSINTIVRNLKDNIRFRMEHQIDQLRLAHTNSTSSDYCTLRNYIQQKKVYVSGYDKNGRSTYYFIPRNVLCHDKQYTRKVHLWTIERAIACSKHSDQTINAIVDFNGFNTNKHSPPISIGKDLLHTLSYHYYSNHIHNVFLVDAPAPFMYMWTMVFKHFINKRTASKIHFVKSSTSKSKKALSTTSMQSHQIDTDEQATNGKPLYHSFEPSTESTATNTQQVQPKDEKSYQKQTFLPSFSTIPFMSSVIQATQASSPSSLLSSYTTTTGLLRAGGDGTYDNNRIFVSATASTSTSEGSFWKSRLFTFGKKYHQESQQKQSQQRQRRNKRTKSTVTSIYATTMNNDNDFPSNSECDSTTSTDTCSATVEAPIISNTETAPIESCESSSSAASNSESDSILHHLYSSDQLPSWILPTGTKNRELDVEEYLDVIPFNRAFDE